MTTSPTSDSSHTADLAHLVLVKGDHQWRFHWDRRDPRALVDTVWSLAQQQDVPFDWTDAAVICRQVRDASRPVKASITPDGGPVDGAV